MSWLLRHGAWKPATRRTGTVHSTNTHIDCPPVPPQKLHAIWWRSGGTPDDSPNTAECRGGGGVLSGATHSPPPRGPPRVPGPPNGHAITVHRMPRGRRRFSGRHSASRPERLPKTSSVPVRSGLVNGYAMPARPIERMPPPARGVNALTLCGGPVSVGSVRAAMHPLHRMRHNGYGVPRYATQDFAGE